MNRLFLLLFGAMSLVAHAQVPDYVPTEGLVAWYSFDYDATDLSENEFSGTVYGAATVEQGYNEGSLYFDGQDDYIEIPTNEVFESIVHQLTLSAWFKKTNEANGTIVAKRNFVGNPCGERHHFELTCMDDQSILFSATHNCVEMHTTFVFSAPETFDLGVWNHVVVTYLNGALKMFVNGSMVIEHDEGYRELLPNNHWVNYGRVHRSGGVPFFQEFGGEIDESGIWNRALTEEEVLALYYAQLSILGCTDPTACNFNEEANEDDGSCVYPPSESVDCEFGGNYCGDGTVWDSSLQTCVAFDDCPADLNGNGLVEVSDLLMVLADFGTECAPPVAEWTCGDPVNYHSYDYATVQIGEQCWFAENLRTSQYSNGDEVPNVPQGADWQAATNDGSGAWAYFSNNPESGETFGKLYNWYVTVDERGICPAGWHVPENAEWGVLVDHYGGAEAAAIELKGNYSDEWFGNGASGFNALPGGFRDYGNSLFFFQGTSGDWWTSSNQGAGFWRGMDSNSNSVHNALYGRAMGNSIRCLKN